jgi:hypothetical protein
MSTSRAESALRPGEDPRLRARQLQQVREAALTGSRRARTGSRTAQPRRVIGESWRRVRFSGLDPVDPPEVSPLAPGEVEERRLSSGVEELLPLLRTHLLPAAEAAGQILVVVDAEGRVLWREGGPAVRRRADALGFVEGSAWDELSVGTNAIGTSLAVGSPVHVYAAEHYAESHQPWTCAAAPLHDPVTGRLLGAVDLSGPASTVHPSTVALVEAVARLAELEVRAQHGRHVERLRSVVAPILSRLDGRALAVTEDGCVAAAVGLSPPEQVLLRDPQGAGRLWLPAVGHCRLEPLPGGWLLRVDEDAEDETAALVLDLNGRRPELSVSGSAGDWSAPLSLRHAELLVALLTARDGRTAAQLSGDVFGEPTRTVTVRAELSRLRRVLGPLLQSQPYRVPDRLRAEIRLPADPRQVLPGSSAPVVERLRTSAA